MPSARQPSSLSCRGPQHPTTLTHPEVVEALGHAEMLGRDVCLEVLVETWLQWDEFRQRWEVVHLLCEQGTSHDITLKFCSPTIRHDHLSDHFSLAKATPLVPVATDHFAVSPSHPCLLGWVCREVPKVTTGPEAASLTLRRKTINTICLGYSTPNREPAADRWSRMGGSGDKGSSLHSNMHALGQMTTPLWLSAYSVGWGLSQIVPKGHSSSGILYLSLWKPTTQKPEGKSQEY